MGEAAGGLAVLLDQGLRGTVGRVEEVHQAIAARSFRVIGAPARPAQVVHDGIAGGVYTAVRRAGTVLAQTSAPLARQLRPRGGGHTPFATDAQAQLALSALNAAWGDRLAADSNPLAIPTRLRHADRDLLAEPAALAAALPAATGRIVVFVHGLGENERSWSLGRRTPEGSRYPTYGSRLADDLEMTPLWLRYNTGRHISQNAAELAELLERTVAAWPVPVREIRLVGHSMGGLAARSACHQDLTDQQRWVGLVRDVLLLGAPHLGAPLEKGTNLIGALLRALPETRPLATALETRSNGVKDLRYGYLLEQDWLDTNPDALLHDSGRDVPLLTTANHYVIAAVLTHDPAHRLGRLLGDLLVLEASAHGRPRHTRRLMFALDGQRTVHGNHFHLLNDPEVYAVMHEWLQRSAASGSRPAGSSAPATSPAGSTPVGSTS